MRLSIMVKPTRGLSCPILIVHASWCNIPGLGGQKQTSTLQCTTFIPNCSSSDFFDPKFDYLSYSKNLYKY